MRTLIALFISAAICSAQSFDFGTGKGTIAANVPAGATFFVVTSYGWGGEATVAGYKGNAPFQIKAESFEQWTSDVAGSSNGTTVTLSGYTNHSMSFGQRPAIGAQFVSSIPDYFGLATWSKTELKSVKVSLFARYNGKVICLEHK